MLFGLPDAGVSAAFLLMILTAAGCVAYGARMWNREGDLSEAELAEENRWAAEERDLEKDLGRGGDA